MQNAFFLSGLEQCFKEHHSIYIIDYFKMKLLFCIQHEFYFFIFYLKNIFGNIFFFHGFCNLYWYSSIPPIYDLVYLE